MFCDVIRRVATCKPEKPGLTSFSETLAVFFIQFLSFQKMKVQDRQNGPSKSFWAYQKKLAGYAPGHNHVITSFMLHHTHYSTSLTLQKCN